MYPKPSSFYLRGGISPIIPISSLNGSFHFLFHYSNIYLLTKILIPDVLGAPQLLVEGIHPLDEDDFLHCGLEVYEVYVALRTPTKG